MRRGIGRAVSRAGVGLHGGRPCRATLRPSARPGWWLDGARVGPDAVADGALATTLRTATGVVSTVEHLFAALYGAGIDDVEITVDGGELPILDGSAAPWWVAIAEAGPRDVPGPAARPRIVERVVRVGEGERWIEARPASRLELAVHIDFPLIGRQRFAAPLTDFAAVADARTFGFARDAAALHAAGKARGASLENVVVFADDGRPLAPLRHPDEPARHKWLDLVGDLALLGRPLRARIEARCAGHALHHALVAALDATAEAAGDS